MGHTLRAEVDDAQPPGSKRGVSTMLGRLWIHAALYALLLVAIAALIPLDASFGGDDGAYGGQVHALERGGWVLQRPLPVVPAANEGWLNTAITPEGPLPYTSNPSYSLLLAAMPGNGILGMQLVPVMGALASAVVAWALVRAVTKPSIDPGPAALAFWLVALGPVLVNSTTLWAHTLSTALGGGALWCVAVLSSGRHRSSDRRALRMVLAPAIGLGLLLALAVFLRTEAPFWVAAIGVTAAVRLSGWFGRVIAAGGVVFAAGAWVVNRAWGAALRADRLPIDTAVVAPENGDAWLAGRLPAAWRLLLTSLGGGAGPLLSLIAMSLAIVAAVRLRRVGDEEHATSPVVTTLLLVGSSGIYLVHAVLAPGETISGTATAWPIVLVLLIARLPRRGADGSPADLGLLLLPTGLFTLAVLGTQYSISGGHQWGGRYLSMAFVPLAAAAAVCGWPLLRSRSHHRVGLAAVLLAPAMLGAVVSFQLHTKHASIVASTSAIPADVVVTEVVALPRIAWTELPTAYYLADDDTVADLLAQLAEAEVGSVNIHGLDDTQVDGVAGYRITATTATIRHLERTASP